VLLPTLLRTEAFAVNLRNCRIDSSVFATLENTCFTSQMSQWGNWLDQWFFILLLKCTRKKQMDNEYQVIFFFRIIANLVQWRAKQWRGGLLGSVIKSYLRLGFSLSNLHQRDKLVSNLPIHILKNFPWHSRPIFYFKPGQIIDRPNVKERLFTDMSLWALGNSTTGLTQSSLSAVFKGNSRIFL